MQRVNELLWTTFTYFLHMICDDFNMNMEYEQVQHYIGQSWVVASSNYCNDVAVIITFILESNVEVAIDQEVATIVAKITI